MKKRIFSILLCVSMLAALLVGCGTKEETTEDKKVLVVGTSGATKPYSFMEGEEVVGFDIDIFNEICNRLGYEVEYKVAQWSGIFGMVDSGDIITIANSITASDERREVYDFSDAYAYEGVQFMTLEGSEPIDSIEDAKGKKIGAYLGGSYEQKVRALDTEGEIEIVTYETSVLLEAELAAGRVDGIVQSKAANQAAIEAGEYKLQADGESFGFDEICYPFVKSEENAKLIEEINGVLKEMHEDGTLTEISNKWFGWDMTVQK